MNPNEPTKPPDRPDGEKPPEVPAAEPKFKVEARARYDDDVPPAPKPVSPEQVRKPTVVEKAAPIAPVVVDRPPEVKELIGDMPASGGFDPSPYEPGSPTGSSSFTKGLVVAFVLVVLLPVAGLVFFAIDCVSRENFGGKW